MKKPYCPDCGVKPGKLHVLCCDVEQCPRCGGQAISCPCIYEVNGMDMETLETEHSDIYTGGPSDEMLDVWNEAWEHRCLPWTGVWPGQAECFEFGWYSRKTSSGWKACSKGDVGAGPDLTRLYCDAMWDADTARFVLCH